MLTKGEVRVETVLVGWEEGVDMGNGHLNKIMVWNFGNQTINVGNTVRFRSVHLLAG